MTKKSKIKFIISMICLGIIFLIIALVKMSIIPVGNDFIGVVILLIGLLGTIFSYPYMKELHDANSKTKPPYS